MKTRVLIIIGMIAGIIILTYSLYAISEINEPQRPSDCRFKYGKGTPEMLECMEKFREIVSIPTAQEFLEMNCEELTHLYPEFPSKEVADAWNTRMHECIIEQESLSLQSNLKKWSKVSCLDILNNPEIEFEDNTDKIAFDIRWKQCLENEN